MDIFWIDHENDSTPLFKFMYYSLSSIAFYRAHKIITISNSTKQRIENKMGVNQNKVKDILISCNKKFSKTSDKTISYLDNLKPYVFYNGSSAKRKNLEILNKIDDQLKSLGYYLIFLLVTKKTGKSDSELDSLYSRENFIIDNNDYSINELSEFYSRSLAFIFPSKYEGFGLPVLEAIKCETIPIISNSTSLPEIVLGDSDFIVDQNDHRVFAEKIIRIINEPKHRINLINKLPTISRSFDWNITSIKTETLYEI